LALIEEALKAYLVASTAVNARLSGRIYPSDVAPQGLLDAAGTPVEYMTYREVGNQSNGYQGGSGTIEETLFSLTVFAATAKAASEIMELIRLRVDNKRGTIGTGSETATVLTMRLGESRAAPEPPNPAQETTIYSKSRNLMIKYRATAATYS